MSEELDIVTLIDEETGEEMQFALVDGFDYKDRSFAVLITVEEKEDESEMLILEKVEEDGGDVMLASLSEEEEDEIYDYYDQLCDEEFDDEDNAEEE